MTPEQYWHGWNVRFVLAWISVAVLLGGTIFAARIWLVNPLLEALKR